MRDLEEESIILGWTECGMGMREREVYGMSGGV